MQDFLQNSIGNSSTSTTCNPIYSEGTILELQITMQFHQQLIHQHHLHPIYNAGTILQLQSTMEFHRQLLHQHHLQCHLHYVNDPTVANHNGFPSDPTVANHNGIVSTAHARKTVETPCTMRNRSDHDPRPIRDRSETDPNMIRPHTRPSRTRRTAEVDHRGSGTHFVWKNIGFRASAQKRISCETSFKTPSATPPPAPLAMPF